MNKRTLAIINSDSIDCTYGGVAPIMRNLHNYLNSAYNIKYYYIPTSWTKFPIPGRIKVLLMILLNWRSIKRHDAILSHVPEGAWIVSFMKVPLVHIFHGNFNPMKGSKYWYGKYFARIFDLFEDRINRKAAVCYTVGPVIGNRKKLYNPINHSIKPKDATARSGFVFAGRLESLKNIDKIIKAYSLLDINVKQNNPLYIAGDGTQKNFLKQLVIDLQEEQNIHFTGSLSNDELINLDSNRKILLMASTHEGLPTAIAEALTVGVPVISTDVGDINRVIKNGFNGYLLPINFEDEEYAQCINSILINYDYFASNALESSKVFNVEPIAQELIESINLSIGHDK